MYHEPLLVVTGDREAEQAAVVLVGSLDVLEAPRRPKRPRQGRVLGVEERMS
jgi:hypothetical protein